jgi:hypothetical protein
VAGDSVRGCRFPRPGDWGVLSSGLIDVVTKLLGHFDLSVFVVSTVGWYFGQSFLVFYHRGQRRSFASSTTRPSDYSKRLGS